MISDLVNLAGSLAFVAFATLIIYLAVRHEPPVAECPRCRRRFDSLPAHHQHVLNDACCTVARGTWS